MLYIAVLLIVYYKNNNMTEIDLTRGFTTLVVLSTFIYPSYLYVIGLFNKFLSLTNSKSILIDSRHSLNKLLVMNMDLC